MNDLFFLHKGNFLSVCILVRFLSDLVSCLHLSSSRSLDGETVIRRDATVIFSRQSAGEKTLQAGGVRDGDFLTVWRLSEVPTANSGASPARQRATTNPPAASGGLDFSALLAANNNAQSSAASRNNGGLSFNIPGLLAASAAASQPIEWDGMKPTTPFNEIPTPSTWWHSSPRPDTPIHRSTRDQWGNVSLTIRTTSRQMPTLTKRYEKRTCSESMGRDLMLYINCKSRRHRWRSLLILAHRLLSCQMLVLIGSDCYVIWWMMGLRVWQWEWVRGKHWGRFIFLNLNTIIFSLFHDCYGQ